MKFNPNEVGFRSPVSQKKNGQEVRHGIVYHSVSKYKDRLDTKI